MKIRFFCAAASLALLVAFTSAQQFPAPQPSSPIRERLGDGGTPGLLQPLRTEPAEPLSIDASGFSLPLADVWEIDQATGAEYRRGEVLVRFKRGTGANVRAQLRQMSRSSRIPRVLPDNWELLQVEADASVADAMATLRRSDSIDHVSLNYRLRTRQLRPNDENYGLQWNFDAINLPYAWQINPGARTDVVVAVLDTGLNVASDTFVFRSPYFGQIPLRFGAVPDLVTDVRITRPYDFVYDDQLPLDLDGHGTHVAGTIAQQTNNNVGVAGVAYNVKLMPLKVLTGDWDLLFASGRPAGSTSTLAEAIRYAADNGAHVINMSLGAAAPQPVIRDAIAYAVGRGVFVAIAAGNDGDRGNPTEYPAAYAEQIRGAMTVGAVNRNLRRASYSGFHSYVEICAPGGETRNDLDYERGITQVGYDYVWTWELLDVFQKAVALQRGFRPRFDRFELRAYQGTSMATPHVAGVAALLYSQGIRNPAAIEAAIKRFATRIDARPDECGAGLIDPRRALRGLGLSR